METDFQRVWNRVKASGLTDDAEVLSGFIRDELRDADDYLEIARKTRALRVRRLLAGLAEDERRHAKRLQAASYMLFGGNTAASMRRKAGDERVLAALRRKYAQELDGAGSYRTAADNTANEALKKLYAEIAAEEQKHAERLCAMLEELL